MNITLMVACWVFINGSLQEKYGREIVAKSGHQDFIVYFHDLEPSLRKVDGNACRYIESPEIVAERPELFYAKFQPDCGQDAYELWKKTSLLTYREACNLVQK